MTAHITYIPNPFVIISIIAISSLVKYYLWECDRFKKKVAMFQATIKQLKIS